MSLDLLDAPLRLTWDIHRPGRFLPASDLLLIADRLRAAGVFFVLLDGRPLAHETCAELVVHLAGGCQTSLVVSPEEEYWGRLGSGWPLRELFLDITEFADRPESSIENAVAALRALGYAPSLLLRPSTRNLQRLPALAELCRRLGVARLKLPNAWIAKKEHDPARLDLPGPEDVEALRRLVGEDGMAVRRDLDIEVHDLFIWEILFSGGNQGRSEYGGCQAANSLGHVDSLGNLFPCSSWPLVLGSLLTTALEDLWQSPLRHGVRAAISRLPAACGDCRDLPLCLGGCRGLAETFKMKSEGRDLMCRGRR
ncbi:SPASM domain-containing protein [Geoalkalibacter sp.]|uniref:SPASM domain-containing protein n=1 Tax=Geoalkalibacter sp. TaxID=3041440 RepID=UPI00272E5C0B|nr:SPASM domain-containing protein [Geoalkalibacter sp.]